MRIVIAFIIAAVGMVLIVFRKYVGPPPNVGPPRQGTRTYAAWKNYSRAGGVLVVIAMIVIAGLYAVGMIA
jgi:hypothetical protein